jgi:lipid-binding SYLF domain-containing protein
MNSRLISTAFVSALLVSPVAVMAASPQSNQNAPVAQQKNNEHQLMRDAVNAIDNAKSDSHFADLLKQAKGVFVVPNLVKGAAIVGGEGGQGVLLAHRNGQWSDPAFYGMGSISIGAQAGGEAGPVVMALMSDKALNDFIDANNFSLNAKAGLSIVNYSAQHQTGFGKSDIVVWSGQSGVLAGADITGTDITQNKQADRNFYGRNVTTKDILNGNVNSAAAAPLRDALPS